MVKTDLEVANQRLDSNAETDKLLTKALLGLFRDLMLDQDGQKCDDESIAPTYRGHDGTGLDSAGLFSARANSECGCSAGKL
jgi:hypothetical protein